MHDVWFVGDEFLSEIFASFQAMNQESRITKKTPPYLYEEFNIIAGLSNRQGLNRSLLGRLLNNLVGIMNKHDQLPKYLLMIIDLDLVKDINQCEFGLGLILERTLKYIACQVNRLIDSRIDNLIRAKPGSVKVLPKIIWFKMIDRCSVPITHMSRYLDDVEGARKKFNTTLEAAVANEKSNFVLAIESLEHLHYDMTGKLLSDGRIQFWKEVDHHMKEFDRGLLKLNPIVIAHPATPKKHATPSRARSTTPTSRRAKINDKEPSLDEVNHSRSWRRTITPRPPRAQSRPARDHNNNYYQRNDYYR